MTKRIEYLRDLNILKHRQTRSNVAPLSIVYRIETYVRFHVTPEAVTINLRKEEEKKKEKKEAICIQ